MLGRDVLISWIWNIPCSSQKTKDFRREIIWDFFWSIWDFFAIFCQPSRYRTWFQASSGNSDSSNWPGFEADVNPRALWEKLGKKNVKGRDPFNQNFRKFRSKLNGSVRSNRKSFQISGPPFEEVLFSRSDQSQFWLNGLRPSFLKQSWPKMLIVVDLWCWTCKLTFWSFEPTDFF